MAKVLYDKDSNILSIRVSPRKSADSDIRGDVIIDYDKDGNVVNIEVMDINLENTRVVQEFIRQRRERVAA